MALMGWLYYVKCPEGWSNASTKGIYHIIEAPHVRAANRNPRWQCLSCGEIVKGVRPPEECPGCLRLVKKFDRINKKLSKLVGGGKSR